MFGPFVGRLGNSQTGLSVPRAQPAAATKTCLSHTSDRQITAHSDRESITARLMWRLEARAHLYPSGFIRDVMRWRQKTRR